MRNIRYLPLGFVTVAMLLTNSLAFAQAADLIRACVGTIQFDTSQTSTNVLSKISLLDTMDASAYSEYKRSASGSASFLGISLGSDFSDFSKNRSEFKRKFEYLSTLSRQDSALFHTVDPGSNDRFRECIASVNRSPFVATVLSVTRNTAYVLVAVNQGSGTSRKTSASVSSVSGGRRVDKESLDFTGSGSVILSFQRDGKNRFEATLQLRDAAGVPLESRIVTAEYMPRYQKRESVSPKTSDRIDCNCGGPGNPNGTVTVTLPVTQVVGEGKKYRFDTRDGQIRVSSPAIWTERNVPGGTAVTPITVTEELLRYTVVCMPGENNSRSTFRVWIDAFEIFEEWFEV